MTCQQVRTCRTAHQRVKDLLCTGHVGYVLVTAKKTNQPDNLEVEFSYEGEVALASYLVDGVQEVLDKMFEQEGEVT